MAIQNRRGPFQKLDTSKLLPGEWAIVLQDDPCCKDGKAAYLCFKAGDTKRISTYEDMVESIENATEDIQAALTAAVKTATDNANTKAAYAKTQGDYAKNQGDYAKEQGNYAGKETANIRNEFDEIKGIILETESGQILIQVHELLDGLYSAATDDDIDSIIAGTYVDVDEENSVFEVATNEDIDAIIAGTYVDDPTADQTPTDVEIDEIISGLFKQ